MMSSRSSKGRVVRCAGAGGDPDIFSFRGRPSAKCGSIELGAVSASCRFQIRDQINERFTQNEFSINSHK